MQTNNIIGIQLNPSRPNRFFTLTNPVKLAVIGLVIFLGLGIAGLFISLTLWSYQAYSLSYYGKENISLKEELDKLIEKQENILVEAKSLSDYESSLRLSLGLDTEHLKNFAVGGRQSLSDQISSIINPMVQKYNRQKYVEEYINLNSKQTLKRFRQTQSYIQFKKDIWRHTPVVKPALGRFTSGFGYRIHPVTGDNRFHHGLDIAAPKWTEIYSAADGIVSTTKMSPSFGKIIVVDHGNGYKTKYAHLEKISVEKGQMVKRYGLLGYMGATGVSTGTHLHYEIHRDNSSKNPKHFILPGSELVD